MIDFEPDAEDIAQAIIDMLEPARIGLFNTPYLEEHRVVCDAIKYCESALVMLDKIEEETEPIEVEDV